MSSSIIEARAQRVQIDEDCLVVDLVDGRTVSVPLVWYPRLWYGSRQERARFELLGEGAYIHWPDLDEDLSFRGLLQGDYGQREARRIRSQRARTA